MKTYRVVIVGPAQKQWRNYYDRILNACGQQPADNTQADLRATIVDLMRTAGSRPLYYEEPIAAAMVEYVSVNVDDTTCVVKDELLPPPCSA